MKQEKSLAEQLIVCGKAYRVLRLLRHVKGGNIDSPRRTDLGSQYCGGITYEHHREETDTDPASHSDQRG